MSEALIIRNRLSTQSPPPTSSMLNGVLLKGTWFQIARWGVHEDLFMESAYAEWTLIPRDAFFFSLSIEVKREKAIHLYEGYATLTEDGIFTPVLNIDETVVSLGDYLVRYTDYAQYTFLSAPGDVLVWSRYPYVRPVEVNILVAKVESYDYSGAKLYVNRASISEENTKSPVKSVLTLARGIPYAAPAGSSTHPRVNTKISLDDDIEQEAEEYTGTRCSVSRPIDDTFIPLSPTTSIHTQAFERGVAVTIRR